MNDPAQESALTDSPVFVLEHEGAYYTTVSLIEYDPKRPDLSEEQLQAIKSLQQLLDENPPVRATIARRRDAATAAFAQAVVDFVQANTDPPPP